MVLKVSSKETLITRKFDKDKDGNIIRSTYEYENGSIIVNFLKDRVDVTMIGGVEIDTDDETISLA